MGLLIAGRRVEGNGRRDRAGAELRIETAGRRAAVRPDDTRRKGRAGFRLVRRWVAAAGRGRRSRPGTSPPSMLPGGVVLVSGASQDAAAARRIVVALRAGAGR